MRNIVRDKVYGKSMAAMRARLNGRIVKSIVKSIAWCSEHLVYLLTISRKFRDEK
jgi:hypothetical protein